MWRNEFRDPCCNVQSTGYTSEFSHVNAFYCNNTATHTLSHEWLAGHIGKAVATQGTTLYLVRKNGQSIGTTVSNANVSS